MVSSDLFALGFIKGSMCVGLPGIEPAKLSDVWLKRLVISWSGSSVCCGECRGDVGVELGKLEVDSVQGK